MRRWDRIEVVKGEWEEVWLVDCEEEARAISERGATGCWENRSCPIPPTGRPSSDGVELNQLWLQTWGPERL